MTRSASTRPFEPPGALGHPRLHLRSTGSTNDRARALAIAGAPHGTLVTADEQTAGRGRHGRVWAAPARSSLLMSLVLRSDPDGPGQPTAPGRPLAGGQPSGSGQPSLAAPLPLLAAIAVCDVVGSDARVKWPNDIVRVRDGKLRKLAGILVEGRPQAGWAVLGIGLNVAVALADLPREVRRTADTLAWPAAEIEPTLHRLLAALARRLDEPAETVLSAWRARDALRGREVAWESGRGHAAGIDDAGRLVVVRADGTRTELDSGEVLPG
ncbi:MAG TPA: biotin--[acetyl-CoA-carboxylase] ligase [Solirubrobacteraceae bacterium]|jgi:BirA family biotin operon repressor/biotin-[acetyl-CoA-carboxylase] ligase